jgi:hypothetical protein
MGTAESPVRHTEDTRAPTRGFDSGRYDDSASADQIQVDIDRTRGEIDQTLDALGERLHPRHLLDDVLDLFRSEGGAHDYGRTARSIGRRAVRQIKDHPVPAMLIGAGLAWMLFEEDEPGYSRNAEPPMYSGSYVDARTGEPYDLETYGHEWQEGEPHHAGMGEKARQTGAAIQGKAAGAGASLKHAGEAVRGAAAGAAARAGEWAGSARHGAARMGHSAGVYGRRARTGAGRMSRGASRRMQEGYAYSRDRFEDALDEYPLAVGVGVLALGLLAGLALPRTRREDEWMGEASDEMKEQAWDTAEDLRERGMEAVQSTAAAARDEAERQGLGTGELMEKVKHVASEAMHAAQETAHQEGIDTGSLKEKGQAVMERTQEQGKQEFAQKQETLK